ncbi:rho guanine nucleotide exchange factor 28 isoform X1 [Fundulus heteroclitus]|uniref:rho guanine nucleotide exchange factor 28 isoform X1 n=1 Tax=Fundulus heteroclitus TaxID=8078 RepID=UPI00165AF3F2|nr:rho guanine nucleotide exchange factor 28 isoform X1 [Fundulus heteroclitus]
MEVNRKEVPLYGQVDGCVLLQETAPKDAQFYVVVQGSRLTHVTTAKRGSDERTLCFTVPGHDRVEVVSVTAYVSLNDGVYPHGCNASLEYVRDAAQDAAEYLSGAWDHSGPQSYQELGRKFPALAQAADEEFSRGLLECRERETPLRGSSGDDPDLRHLDQEITLALANMDYPQQWKNTDWEPRQGSEHRPKETLIHLAVRLHLVHLARFLIHQTGGQRLLSLPNEEGETPLQLAQRDGLHSTFRDLAVPSVAAVDPLPGVFCLWADSSCMLRFCPGTESVFLTLRQAPGCPQDAITLLKERLEDHGVCRQMNFLRADARKHKCHKKEAPLNDGGFSKELNVDGNPLADNIFEDQPTLFLIDTDSEEENSSSLSVNGHLSQNIEVQNQFSPCASDSLLSMINGSNQSLARPTQSCEEDVKFKVDDVTSDSTGTDGSLWDPEDLLLATDTPPPHSHLEDLLPASIPGSLSLSPVDRALTRLSRRPSTEPNNHRDSPPMETCDISLVALEVDSEEEAPVPKSLLSRLFSDIGKSEEKKETPRPAPDLSCTRSQSASACEPVSKDSSEEGVRLRSYSYSYSKFCPSRSPRDNHPSEGSPDGVLHSVSHSRSLLQALSLSKSTLSLSLLHPGKQRASSISEQSNDKREVRFRKRAQSADDEGSVELAESLQHLTLSEFLKEIEEEELEKCNIPTKAESEKYKVIRTFSFLKNRMSSTRNKNKGKGKDREGKDRHLNGHRFGSGSCLGSTTCVVCDKPASGKDLLHCSGCTTIVHKSCKESVPPCLKKLQDRYALTAVKSKTASLPQNFTVRESSPHSMIPVSVSQPVLTPKERKEAVTQSGSLPGSLPNSDSLLSENSEAESEALKPSSRSEELLPTPGSSASNESTFGEDCVDSYIHTYSDILADSAEYEAESWSLTVEHKFCKRQDKRAVKRQDVIYELMQTELHHLQTLHIMAEVFRRGMKEEVQLDSEAVERVFPCLDQLLGFHHAFFAAMKERRQSSGQPQGHRNYLIQQIGDILLQQFSEENGEKMKQVYGEFCSHHNEAVSFFKDLLLHNKRFQSFIKQQGHNSLVRRREIPECILLVTQRITKYPVLLERILHYTQEDTEEHGNLSKALAHIREVIAAVDLRVSEYERHQRLQEVCNRMENRSSAKLKSGLAFRKQDMMGPGQTLRYQGMLLWKTATGRLKDVLALLLTDALIFLQEKDQKYTFATVDQKPPVISLQKLIVREVANEEKGMFLISASSAGPEMYEVHTSSKEERNTWMRLIREAVESCPEEPEECASESEEEKRAAEARFQKILRLQESLTSQDQQICSSLEEKLQIYTELSALTGMRDAALVEARLLVQPQVEELPQAAGLLAAALQEAESLKAALSSKARSLSSHSQDSDSVFPVSPSALSDPAYDSSEDNGGSQTDAFVLQSVLQKDDNSSLDLEAAESVQTLTQLLYSLQAAVTIQDTCYEVQRLLLQASEHSPRTHCLHFHGLRGNTLQEQEKQRNLEKRKEEVATAKRLGEQLRQEKERWERECQLKEIQQVEQESRLEERERKCQLAAEKLRQEREELVEQLDEYQQSLERLREGQRIVERERERLEGQQKLLQVWTHGRQSSLPTMIPHMVIPLDGHQASPPNNSRHHAGVGSVFVNEAAFVGDSINNRHIHHKRNDPNAHNCFNSLLDRSNNRRYPVVTSPLGTSYIYNPLGRLQHSTSDPSYNGETWMSTADPNPELPHPSEHQLELSALVSLETDSDQEEGREETIVFL